MDITSMQLWFHMHFIECLIISVHVVTRLCGSGLCAHFLVMLVCIVYIKTYCLFSHYRGQSRNLWRPRDASPRGPSGKWNISNQEPAAFQLRGGIPTDWLSREDLPSQQHLERHTACLSRWGSWLYMTYVATSTSYYTERRNKGQETPTRQLTLQSSRQITFISHRLHSVEFHRSSGSLVLRIINFAWSQNGYL